MLRKNIIILGVFFGFLSSSLAQVDISNCSSRAAEVLGLVQVNPAYHGLIKNGTDAHGKTCQVNIGLLRKNSLGGIQGSSNFRAALRSESLVRELNPTFLVQSNSSTIKYTSVVCTLKNNTFVFKYSGTETAGWNIGSRSTGSLIAKLKSNGELVSLKVETKNKASGTETNTCHF